MMDGKKIVLYYFLAVLFLSFSQILPAQSINKPYYHFKTFTTDDGLCSNNVNCVFKDSKGFLWIGTDRGIQQFNGSSFLTFRHLNADSNSICNETINTITEDGQHDIWIATRGGITKFSYSNGRLTNYIYGYKNGQPVSLGIVSCFFEDSRGRQWIGTVGSGLYLFDKTTQHFTNYPPAAYLGIKQDWIRYVSAIQESEKKELIFGVQDGFVIIDKEGKQEYITVPEPADKKIVYQPCFLLPLLKDYPDEVWISSLFNGIFCYNRVTKKWKHFNDRYSGNPVTRVINWTNDEWMCCYKDGVYIFNHRTGVFSKQFDDERINSINNIYLDKAGTLYLSSNSRGLHLLNISTQLFASTTYVNGWGQGHILQFDSSRQTLYAVNPYNAADIIALHTSTQTVTRHSLPGAVKFHNVINNFIADNNMLYFARWGDMCQYNVSTKQFNSINYKAAASLKPGAFFDVCQSATNVYFTGNYGGGGPFMYNKQTGIVTDLTLLSAKKLNSGYHSYSVCFSNHVLYTGMNYGDSIYCYNEITGKKYAVAIPPCNTEGNSNRIQTLCVDKKQNLWCGFNYTGLYVYNIPTQKWIKQINQQQGKFVSSISQLVCDDDDNVWCSSSEGLYAFNTGNFLFKNYISSHGLLSENNGGFLALMSNHQLAYSNIMGTDVSFGIINTKPVDTAIQTIPISITHLKVSGNLFLADTLLDNVQQVTLPPNQNAFSLSYAGVTITEAKNLLYSYLLKGAEKYWHEVGSEQSLSYLNLSPGNYVLHIKCKSRNEKIIGNERLLYITLLPAWNQTWWFKTLIIFACSFVSFIAIRYYLRQQLKKQQAILEKERALTEERNRIAADMHDDVGAGLSRIRYITASMKDKKDKSDEDIDKIVSLSDESVEKMNEIIWALNQGNQQLDELIYYTRSQCSEMVSNAGLAFTFDLPENIPAITLNWKDCRNIYLLVKEAVNNAIKHAGADTITIQCSIFNQLQFSVADNGKGFEPDTIRKNGNGLLNYKRRVEKLNGNCEVISNPGEGTKIVFNIPIINFA